MAVEVASDPVALSMSVTVGAPAPSSQRVLCCFLLSSICDGHPAAQRLLLAHGHRYALETAAAVTEASLHPLVRVPPIGVGVGVGPGGRLGGGGLALD